MNSIKLVSTGSYLPQTTVTNDDLSKLVDTNDEWIKTRTGIGERRFAKQETNLEMACKAGEKAVESSGLDKKDITVLIVATFTSEYFTPSLACLVQKHLNLSENVMAFDLNAACTGFVYALQTANALLAQCGGYALVIGSDKTSSVMDFTDRNTCVLFGDGAGAVIIKTDETQKGVFEFGCRGDETAIVCNAHQTENQNCFLQMNGKDVFRFATEVMHKSLLNVFEKSKKSPDEIQHIICHQANVRIISHVAKKMGLPIERFFLNLHKYGNTSAASIALCIDELNQNGALKKGDSIAVCGFGAGLTWGGTIITV